MQFEIHWDNVSLYIPQVIDLYIHTLPLVIVAGIVAALRVRTIVRKRKAVSNTVSNTTAEVVSW